MRITTLVLSLFFVSGLLFTALPYSAQAQVQESGCCQFIFDGEPGGCLYPSDPDSCGSGKIEGKYVEGANCNIDTGMCEKKAKDSSEKTE